MLIWREVCFTNSLTSGGVFNANLLEVNKIQQSVNLGRHATVYTMGFKLFTRSSRNIKAQRYRRRLFSIIFLQIFIRLNRVRNQNRKTVWANPLKVRKAVTYPLVF